MHVYIASSEELDIDLYYNYVAEPIVADYPRKQVLWTPELFSRFISLLLECD